MTPEERAERLSRLADRVAELQPLIDQILIDAEQSALEHAEFFAKLRNAEASDPVAKRILLKLVDDLEEAMPSERAELLSRISVKRKRGRPEGRTEIGEAYRDAVADILRRVDDGDDDERQADVINEWAAALARPELKTESIKTQLRDRVRIERGRRSIL